MNAVSRSPFSNWSPLEQVGRVTRMTPTHIHADGPAASLGTLCQICCAGDGPGAYAQIVAVHEDEIILMPLDQNIPIEVGADVLLDRQGGDALVSSGMTGRVLDALANPVDGGGPIKDTERRPLLGEIPSPLHREDVKQPLLTGVRVLDGLLPLGVGQRVGIFAASGGGKTSLIRQILNGAEYDKCVLCLVGERGREVETIWQEADQLRSVCFAATSDQSPVLRVRAVDQALALAEHWRDQGEHVLLVLDSITRYAMALREIGLAAGEPPTVRAYTPSVFTRLPRVVERCGALRGKGAISAVMTVLAEGDDVDDPIVEVMKSLLDGHVVLSRRLAEEGLFPAVDVLKSASRTADRVVTREHLEVTAEAKRILSDYEQSRLMIESGLYKPGANPDLDRAIAARKKIRNVVHQPLGSEETAVDVVQLLRSAMEGAQ